MMEDTLILLRFNCPDGSCDYIASGWSDLKLHVRGLHGNLMWYECSPSLTPGCSLNRTGTANFAFGRRKCLPTNTQHILQTGCRITYPLFQSADNLENRKASRLKFIQCASFVGSALLVMTNCLRTCGNTKNVSSVNEMESCINSEYAFYQTRGSD